MELAALIAAVGETLEPAVGMVSTSGDALVVISDNYIYTSEWVDDERGDYYASYTNRHFSRNTWFAEFCPDFEHPATLGCLIAQVRQIAGTPVVAVHGSRGPRHWVLYNMPPHRGMHTNGLPPRYDSEVEAYLAAYLTVRP